VSAATTPATDPARGRHPAASIAGAIEAGLEDDRLSLPLCRPCAPAETTAVDADALARLAASEPVVTAVLLREANGPIFNALEPADSVEQAIERLGCEGALGLVSELDAERRRDRPDPVLDRALLESRTRSLVVARIGARIAETTGHSERAAKTALLGLLSDIGVPFLVRALGPHARELGDAPELNEFATREILAELSLRCGHRLLVRWNLAPQTLAVLQGRAVDPEERSLATLLGMAQTIVTSVGRPPVGRASPGAWSQELWNFSETLGLSDVAVAALQVQAEDEIEAVERGAGRE